MGRRSVGPALLPLQRRRADRPQRQAARAGRRDPGPAPGRQRPHDGQRLQRRLRPVLEPGPPVAVGEPLPARKPALRRRLRLPEGRRQGAQHAVRGPPEGDDVRARLRRRLLPQARGGQRRRGHTDHAGAVRRRPAADRRGHHQKYDRFADDRVVVRVLGRQPLRPGDRAFRTRSACCRRPTTPRAAPSRSHS